MSKRAHSPDIETQRLIDELQAGDEAEARQMRFKNDKLAILRTYDVSIDEIKKEYKVTSIDEIKSNRLQLLFKQSNEFHQTLRDDRLQILKEKEKKEEMEHSSKCSQVQKRRRVDFNMKECSEIAAVPVSNCSFQKIGKTRHLQHILKGTVNAMSTEQQEIYSKLMIDLKNNGHKVLD